jgi:hypothetical protein
VAQVTSQPELTSHINKRGGWVIYPLTLITHGSIYVVKRYKVSFQKCMDKCVLERKGFTSFMTDNWSAGARQDSRRAGREIE